MKKYFRTTNATRLYRIGNKSFKFESCVLKSSSWIGVYETESEEDAALLSSYGKAITEIDKAEFDDLKKKDLSSTAQQLAPKPKEKNQEKDAVTVLSDEISVGKATYRDSIEDKS